MFNKTNAIHLFRWGGGRFDALNKLKREKKKRKIIGKESEVDVNEKDAAKRMVIVIIIIIIMQRKRKMTK